MTGSDVQPDRAAALEQRLAGPVVLAALASVPAMFLTMFEGTAASVGNAVNYASLTVLTAESVVLLALAGDRRRWLREHAFMVTVAVVAVPAVLLALGPVQVLRVIRVFGALRIVRVRRVLRAGRILRERAGLEGRRWRVASTALSLVAALFVAMVLVDPSSTSRQFVDSTMARFGPLAVLVAAGLLAGSTAVVASARRRVRDRQP